GSPTGVSPSRTLKYSSCGVWRPKATSVAGSGVAINSPIGPHSQAQKTADTITATDGRPVLEPYSQGSTALVTSSSRTTYMQTTRSGVVQPSKCASDSRIGMPAAISGPTYGTKRSTSPSTAHISAFGTPSSVRPIATGTA